VKLHEANLSTFYDTEAAQFRQADIKLDAEF